MKIFDINGNLQNVDVRQSTYPMKHKSKSSLQGMAGQALMNKYPMDVILEEFPIPGSKLSVDFFLPKRHIAVEIQGSQHDHHVPFYHGDKNKPNKFAGQISRDRIKSEWADTNGFTLIEIRTEKDLENI